MTAAELISELEKYDPNMIVRFMYDYGDRSNTMVTPEVNTVSEGYTDFSSYVNEEAFVEIPDDEKVDDQFKSIILS